MDGTPMPVQLTVECLVCLDDAPLMRTVNMCCCGQIICVKCYNKWFLDSGTRTRATCPTCRTPHYYDYERTVLVKGHIEAGKSWALFEEAGSQFNQGNHAKSLELLLRAQEMGENRSLIYLGLHYEKGRGVTKSLDEAIKYYTRGSDAGIEMCSYNLGMVYYKKEDSEKALHYMKVALHQKSEPSYYTLGLWNNEGKCGLPKDEEKGHELMILAADSGFQLAQLWLGIFYFERGPKQSIELSLKYLHMSLETVEKPRDYCVNYVDSIESKHAMFYIGMCSLIQGDAQLIAYYWFKRYLSTNPTEPEKVVSSAMTMMQRVTQSLYTQCDHCSKTNCELKSCGGCRASRYCSKKCQSESWTDHKDLCKKIRKL